MEVDLELYNKLLKCAIFRASPKIRTLYDKKKVQLDADTIALFENGMALGKYLIVLKEIFRKGNQDFNVDVVKMQTMKNQFTPQAKLYNWNLICEQLDKLGISIDSDIRSLIVAGDQEQIINLFMRIERFVTKVSGKQINFDLYTPGGGTQTADTNTEKTGNARRGNKPNQKKKVIKDGVDILTMNPEREIADTESSLELILNTLCKAFIMKPKQAAALLTNNNQFLIHSIVKGVKGRYEPLISWYQDLYSNSKHLTTLLELETEQFPSSQNFVKVLQTLSCGLYSHNLDIAKWCSKLLTKIGYDFGQHQQLFNQSMTWFLEKEGGLELSLHALKKHPDLAEDFVLFVQQFSSINDQVEQVYKIELKKYFSSPLEYVNAINDLLPFLQSQVAEGIRKSGLLEFWLESCIRQADNDGKHSYDERIAAITLLTEIWLSFTDIVDKQKEEVANSILSMLKRAARDKHKPIRVVAISQLFKLLDKFSEEKNNSAPSVYKTLIFSLVENPGDSSIRQLYFVNFISLYEANPSIPIGLLIEPLIKQIQVTEGITYFFKIFDFDFFTFLAKHPKLLLQHAIPLADLLAKVYLNDVCYASAAKIPFVLICSRFLHEEPIQEFLIKFETICLSMLMGLEKNAEELQQKHQQMLLAQQQAQQKGKRILALPAPPPPQKKVYGKKMTKEQKLQKMKEQDEDLQRRLKKSNIVEISIKVQNLKNEEINDQLRDMYLSTNKRFNELYGYFNKGIMALLKWWGDPDQVMGSYIRAIEEREQKEREEQERKIRMEQERIKREQEEKERMEKEEREKRQIEVREKMKLMNPNNSESVDEEDRRLMLGYDSENGGEKGGSKHQSVRNSMAVMPYTGKQNSNLKNFRAIQEIEKIKRNKQQAAEYKKLEEERRRLNSARKKKKLKEQLEKRKIELGVTPVTGPKEALIYHDPEEQYTKMQQYLDKKLHLPQTTLLDLNEEEERDKQSIQEFMKKYQKLWKNLFYKYANSGFSSKQVYDFNQLGEKLSTLNSAEVTKMLKDHNTYPNLINQEEIQRLFRLINTKVLKHGKGDLQALQYPGFQEFVMQLAFFCFTRPPKDLSTLPPVETLRALVSHFEQAVRSRGLNPILYEDPDATGLGDKQLLKALNDKVAQDSSYPIPEGFFKQIEKIPNYEYKIAPSMYSVDEEGNITSGGMLSEAQVLGVEMMDSFLNELFGFHILEPLVTFEEKIKVRPLVKNQFKPQAEALNYMKKVEKKVKPLEQQLNDKAKMNVQEKRKNDLEIKPQLNLALKLEVANYPLKERPYIQEVAEVFEEVLQAAEKGLQVLPARLHRAPGQIMNEVKNKNLEKKQEQEEIKNQKEEKRQKRDNEIKNDINKAKEEKQTLFEQTRQQRQDREAREREQKKQKEQEMRRKIDEAKAKIMEQRQSNIEELQKKKQDEEEKNKELNDQKKRERAEFLKKQKEKLVNEFDQMQKEREIVEQQKEELQRKQKEFEQRIRGQMEDYIKEHQGDRQKELDQRVQINELLHQHDVESVFGLYNNSLSYFYKFYANQDKKDLNFTLEKSLNQMSFREFVRFGFQQNIVPALLPPEQMVQIFRELIREKLDELNGKIQDDYLVDKNFAQVLDFDYFKKALVRIAIMAQDNLGGQKEDLFLQKLDEETRKKEDEQRKRQNLKQKEIEKHKQEKEMEQQMKEEFKKKQEEMLNKTSKSPKKGENDEDNQMQKRQKAKQKKMDENLEISAVKKQNEEAFFNKWMKQREAQGISLKKRIIGKEKEGTKKIIKKRKVKIEGGEEGQDGDASNNKGGRKGGQTSQEALDQVRDGDDFEDGGEDGAGGANTFSTPGINRKTKTAKELKELQEKAGLQLNKEGLKIEDKRIKQELQVQMVSAKTIEALLRFLGIEPDDHRYVLDQKLNQQRIEIQGQKPTKIKKALKPQSKRYIFTNNHYIEFENIKEGADHQKEGHENEENHEGDNQEHQEEDEGNNTFQS